MTFLVVSFVVLIGLLLYMLREAFYNQVVIQELSFADFPETFEKVSIFFISDIHKRNISTKIINQVMGKVDIVIIGGDLMEKGVPFEKVKRNLAVLKKLGPTYFVWGNNDYEVDHHELDALLLSQGVKILDNTVAKFESAAGEVLVLLGIDDLNQKRDRLDYALEDAGEEGFRILAAHDPRIMVKIKPSQQIRLVLSGHTHGGQIRIFGFGPYEKGKTKKIGETVQLISNGYGTTSIPLRLGARAETHLIILKKG